MKPFNLEEAKDGAHVCTRGGHSVRIICYDREHPNYPIVALIYSPNEYIEDLATCRINGQYVGGQEHQYDLFMAEEEHEEHYDISNFKPFDKVLSRDSSHELWIAKIYSHFDKGQKYPFYTTSGIYKQCIPYNEETAHLVGTTDMPPKKYINW